MTSSPSKGGSRGRIALLVFFCALPAALFALYFFHGRELALALAAMAGTAFLSAVVAFSCIGRCMRLFGKDVRERDEALTAAREAMERQVRERTQALAETNAHLESFNYSISHDLRAPLRAIDGFSQILLNEHARGLTPEGKRLLGIVVKNTKQMARLIDDLLAFSRLGRQDPTLDDVDMAALARDTFDELVAGEPARPIDFQLGPLPTARGDPAMLRQVWANLLSNALKFTGRTARAIIAVTGEVGADGATYAVKDNGAGFDPKFALCLFQVF